MAADRRSKRAYQRAKTCCRCQTQLGSKRDGFLWVVPCGHVLCQDCFHPCPFTASLCDRCGSCVWRASQGPDYGCPHRVPHCKIRAGEAKPAIDGDFFLCNDETVGKQCGRCAAEALLRRYTAEARALEPRFRYVFACLGTRPDALHGQAASGLGLGDGRLDALVPALNGFGARKKAEFVAALGGRRREQGWRPELLDEDIVFRESFIDAVCEAEIGLGPVDGAGAGAGAGAGDWGDDEGLGVWA